MAINELKDVLHRIRVKLYPNYLPHVEGKYFARTVNEKTLSIEDVCVDLVVCYASRIKPPKIA